MCAISGIFDLHHSVAVDAHLLQTMTDAQRHRGPDGSGVYLGPGIGLGHRRLAVIAPASGQQPLFNEDHSAVVVFNGEIYNYRELAQELQRHGHIFRSQSDTEVLVHAWEQWGQFCVERLRGMFAFAIWDNHQHSLFLARDRIGIKPLHYAVLPCGQLLFASEIKALLCDPRLQRKLDPCAIEEYFSLGYVAEPRSIYRHIHKLEAGHSLLLRRGAALAAPQPYWKLDCRPHYRGTLQQAGDELLARLQETIALHSQADVPLGAFLSGGVDSSAVVALLAHGPETLQATPPAHAGAAPPALRTCSISFADPRFDESRYAATVAQRYGTIHHSRELAPLDLSMIDRLQACYDEPFADSSALPTYHLCQMARQYVTVALSGDGGDETMAGYRRYRWHLHEERWRKLLPLRLRRSLFGTLAALYPKADWAPRALRAKTTLQALSYDATQAYFHSVSLLRDGARQSLFSQKLRRALDGYHASAVLQRHALGCNSDDALSRIQYLDLKTYLNGDILTKVDRASMAHGLEVRVPLLDHKLVEWLATVPSHYKLQHGTGKLLFKRMLAPYLPDTLLYRRKMGFALPLCDWLRGSLRSALESAILSEEMVDSGWFNPHQIQHLYSQHMSGRHDHSSVLWSLLMFASFLRQQADSTTPQVSRQAA